MFGKNLLFNLELLKLIKVININMKAISICIGRKGSKGLQAKTH